MSPPALGVSWDGTGYGLDGTVWGGEFFVVTETAWERVAHLRCFPLPGGERAVKEPRRTALGLLFEMLGEAALEQEDLAPVRAFSRAERGRLQTMLARRLNTPLTSTPDGSSMPSPRSPACVSKLVSRARPLWSWSSPSRACKPMKLIRFQSVSFRPPPLPTQPFPSGLGPRTSDFAVPTSDFGFRISDFRAPASHQLIGRRWSREIIAEVRRGVPAGTISARFHNTLAEVMVEVARRTGQERVVLSGGCFQNRYLTERAVERLQSAGFGPDWQQRVPPNDGGIALGQAVGALRSSGDWPKSIPA